jgi:predicted aconitase with swiveling domain
MIRLGTAPAGVILTQADPMVVVASLVASELYAIILPVLVLDDARLRTGGRAEIRCDGEVRFTSPGG